MERVSILSLMFSFIILFKASAYTNNEETILTPLSTGNLTTVKATTRPNAKEMTTFSTCQDCQQMYVSKKVEEVIHERGGARGGGENVSRQPQKSQAIGRLNILPDATELTIVSVGLLVYHMLL